MLILEKKINNLTSYLGKLEKEQSFKSNKQKKLIIKNRTEGCPGGSVG